MLLLARKVLFLVCCAAGATALVRDTLYQGQDFEVFWRAANAVLSGMPVYDLSREGGMIFKYPPWILPAFLPFGLVSLGTAKLLWGLLEIGALASCFLWILRSGANRGVAVLVLFSFWGIWAVHALDGQVTLIVLAICLWFRPREAGASAGGYVPEPGSGARLSLVLWALSTKVFSLVSALFFVRWGRRSWKPWLVSAVIFCALSLPALWVTPGKSPDLLVRSWVAAASSGGTHLTSEKVRGRENQGFPALTLRMLRVGSENSKADLLSFLVVGAILLPGTWLGLRRSALSRGEKWAIWLAVGATVHPLAWFHLFVLAFPLAVFTVNRAVQTRKAKWVAVSVLGVLALSAITRNTAGAVGELLELASIKAWGVLVCALALGLMASRSRVFEEPGLGQRLGLGDNGLK